MRVFGDLATPVLPRQAGLFAVRFPEIDPFREGSYIPAVSSIRPPEAIPTVTPTSNPPASHDDLKERVRDAIDIVDLVGSYLSLRRQGKAMVGLCPWHEDSRPSFHVNPERQTFRCWVCNIGGDAFSFLMKMERLEFREALEQLAQRAGIDMPRGRGGIDGRCQPFLV